MNNVTKSDKAIIKINKYTKVVENAFCFANVSKARDCAVTQLVTS